MKTSYTSLTIILIASSASYSTANNNNGTSLEQCFPSDLPWYTYEGEDYIFSRMRYNSICVDSNNHQYQWGKIEGVYPPIDDPGLGGGCSAACVSGYGRGEQRGCTSMKPEKLVGFNYNCDEAACYCLYEKNTWSGNSSPCFDSMDTIWKHGKGDVFNTRVKQGSTCYSLHVQPAPTPSPTHPRGPPPGSSICTRKIDRKCYKTGRPACCSDDEYECPSFMTMCDNYPENSVGVSYCLVQPQWGCDPATWTMGMPKCCSMPGGDIMNCPKEHPPCHASESGAASVSTSKFVKYLRAANN